MPFHHVAIAAKDIVATHEFYCGPMGFRLVKVVAGVSPEGGWAKHLFYDTGGGGLLAFWELHDDKLPADWSPSISVGLGLPSWVNHIAFAAEDVRDLEARKARWLEHGVDLWEIDHGWCRSVYATDPNGILVEFCVTTQEFTQADRDEAQRLLEDPHPQLESAPPAVRHRARRG